MDSETGLYFYRARYYDGLNRRFISEDPIGFDGGDGNLYRYVGNSPVNYVDPSGNFVPPSSGLGTVLSNLGGTLLKGLGALGGLLYTPGGGGLLNPLPTANEDEILKELQNQQNNPTTPALTPEPAPLLPPPKRPAKPESSPKPNPSLTPKTGSSSSIDNPSNCEITCDNDPYNKYDRCSDLVGPSWNFGGYQDKNIGQTLTFMKNLRGKHPNIKDFRDLMTHPKGGEALDYKQFKDPNNEAKHYNIFIKSLFQDRIEQSAGSIAECKCCVDQNPPKIESRFAILNIKDNKQPQSKYFNRGR